MTDQQNLKEVLKERFKQLAPPVQRAIVSEDVAKNLRQLAETHKLHLDQWEALENEVQMALFGISPIDELQQAIEREVKVPSEIAAALTADVSRIVFEPIRQELERELEHPAAQEKQVSDVEAARSQLLETSAARNAAASAAPVAPVVPATPPPPPPTEKAVRSLPASGAYKPGEASAARKDVHDDPYREPPA